VELGNQSMRLDFDPRTSDTFYNYIHIHRPDTGQWQRAYNFGIDVRTPRPDNPALLYNLLCMRLELERQGRAIRVVYPGPLVQIRQFDDKISPLALIERYPDFTRDEMDKLVHADGSVEFVYEIDPDKPSYTVRGKVLSGLVRQVAIIVNGLWVEDQPMPTHEFIEGFPEFDMAKPEARLSREVEIANVAYTIFYRHDGQGLPLALLPLEPVKADMINFFDNWQCLRDFGQMARNQVFAPKNPPVKGCNDSAYQPVTSPDGTIPGVRVVFFPELGWGRGGEGLALRERLVAAIQADYWGGQMWWNKPARGWPTIKMMSPLP